jgi:hypothetical protein
MIGFQITLYYALYACLHLDSKKPVNYPLFWIYTYFDFCGLNLVYLLGFDAFPSNSLMGIFMGSFFMPLFAIKLGERFPFLTMYLPKPKKNLDKLPRLVYLIKMNKMHTFKEEYNEDRELLMHFYRNKNLLAWANFYKNQEAYDYLLNELRINEKVIAKDENKIRMQPL